MSDWWLNLIDNKKFWPILALLVMVASVAVTMLLLQRTQYRSSSAEWPANYAEYVLCAPNSACGKSGLFPSEKVMFQGQLAGSVKISGSILRDSGDQEPNESVALYLDDDKIFESLDRPGMQPMSEEPFEVTIEVEEGFHRIVAKHADTSSSPATAGSLAVSLTVEQTGEYSLSCNLVKVYDLDWQPLAADDVYVGQTIYLAVSGQTNHPDGITKARFSPDNKQTWIETTQTNDQGEYYIEYQIESEDPITLYAQVYNPELGWQ